MSLEQLLIDAGGYGRFQFVAMIIVFSGKLMAGWSMFQITYVTLRPDFFCTSNSSAPEVDDGSQDWTNYTVNSCSVPTNLSDPESETEGCSQYVYTGDTGNYKTIVTEWNLVCGASWITDSLASIQMSGLLVGCLIAGQIGDVWGRRKTNALFVALHCFSNIINSFSISWEMFAVCLFMIGAGIGGVLVVAFTYTMEFLPTKWRPLNASFPAWAVGMCIYTLVAWMVQDWRNLLLICGCVGLIEMPFLLLIPESLRWCAVQGRLEEAEQVLAKITKWNGKKMPENAAVLLKEVADEEQKARQSGQKYTYIDVLRPWRVAKITLIVCYHWFTYSLTYYGISFGVSSLAGDFFLNTLLMGLLELPLQFFMFYTNNRFGRKPSAFTFAFIATGCALACMVLQVVGLGGSGALTITILSLAARTATNSSWIVIQTWGPELYPTVTRNLGYGIGNTMARVAGIVAPIVIDFDNRMTVSYIIIAALMVGDFILILLTPETRGKQLEDSMTLEVKVGEEMKVPNGSNGHQMKLQENGDHKNPISDETSSTRL